MNAKLSASYLFRFLFWTGSLILGINLSGSAQVSDVEAVNIPLNRMLWHEQIDTLQQQLDRMDGKADGRMRLTDNEDANSRITDVFCRQTDALQREIEVAATDHNRKVGQLRNLKELLQLYQSRIRIRKRYAPYATELFDAYKKCLSLQESNYSLAPAFQAVTHQTGSLLLLLFPDRQEIIQLKNIVFLKRVAEYPEIILKEIHAYESAPFADSLIAEVAARNPLEVYAYAQAGESVQATLIKRSNYPQVKWLAQLAQQSDGALLLPFLDELVEGNISADSLKGWVQQPKAYYRLLVQTAIRNQTRKIQGDTSIMAGSLSDMLKRQSSESFVQAMNALHDEPDAVRFSLAEDLTAAEIYYLLVSTEEIIYTSTYTHLFKQMMERAPGKRSDSLLMQVQLDHFKKFIKVAAYYNRLDEFLQAMPEQSSKQLIYAFANGLQQTRSLEDAVDVADSYASITNPVVKKVVKTQVQVNYQKALQEEDKRGAIIYGILNNLFLSLEDTSANLSDVLGIPSIYKLPYASLADDSGRIVQQVFFYGDEDGLNAYRSFINQFQSKSDWQITALPEWVEIRSLKSGNFTIYANLPLDNKSDLDQQAQEHLMSYFIEKRIAPSIVVHRGHSYHLKYTLQQLLPSAQIIVLGSCGGYQNLGKLLDVNENAHVISTKQIGSQLVNEPILKLINEHVRGGKNIEWIPFWQQLMRTLQKDPKALSLLKDYIPPHRNHGLLFMKAYRLAMPEEKDTMN